MNPLSAHPPRTPKSSVNTTNSMPFSHSDSKKEVMDEQASEIDVEVDNDDEAQEKIPAKIQVRAQDVWREFLKTSGGRDKALVLHFTSPAATSTD